MTRHTLIPYLAVTGWPLDFCLHGHPVSVNCLYHARMVLSVGGSFARNARCTVTTDFTMWYSNTQNDFYPESAMFSLHTLASPSGRNVNYDEKQLTGEKNLSCSFYLYRFRKYVSYGFPTINFCNPRAHYETPVWECGLNFLAQGGEHWQYGVNMGACFVFSKYCALILEQYVWTCVELFLYMLISSVPSSLPLDYHQQTEEEQWCKNENWRGSPKGTGGS
jgi:hypothetical protein